MASRIGQSDLFAGGVAAALLLLLALVLDVSAWVAILLAAAVYIGMVLARPQLEPAPDASGEEHRVAFESARRNLDAVRRLEPRVGKADVRAQVERIANRAGQVLAVIEEDRMFAAAGPLNERLVEPFAVMLDEYVRLSGRGLRSAQPLLERTESHDLPMLERAFDTYYERLHRGKLVDLATHAEMLEINVESLDRISPRRSAP
jgi:hypothetical protein